MQRAEALSKDQFVACVLKRQDERKKIREKGIIDARSHSIENTFRINKRLHSERGRRNYKW